jgi:putative membrane-bound dehydrogenase-like protein
MFPSLIRIAVLAALAATPLFAAEPAGIRPLGAQGQPLNLDFESGDLRDWKAEGNAWANQPVKGDLSKARRGDMTSAHTGEFWVGGYEKVGDDPQGTLTSVPFKVTQPWASFRFAAGAWPETRVELVDAANGSVFLKLSGTESETLRPVVVDLKDRVGKEIFIRLVDQRSGHWGHVNFDDFAFHAARPTLANEYTLAEAKKNEPPPADAVLFAGLEPAEAAAKATLPPGFKLHVFAAEPQIVQPIAFCLDDRGRTWVAEGRTYPRRKGNPPKPEAPSSKPTPEQLKDILGGADRILVLEDTDGDHKADKTTVFLENVNLISGLEVGFGGVWIGAAPYLLFVPVNDWDNPKPAAEPKILLDGWNYSADTHETLNTFTWGPDGWLYGCHGVFCPSHVGKPGATEKDRQWMDAGTFRYHPVKHTFEVFTEGGSNPWGIDFDEHGQLWSEMCVIPHLFHMIQGARITRQGGEHFTVGAAETARNEKHRDPRGRKPVFPYVYEDITVHADHLHYAGNQGPHAGNGRSDSAGGGHAHAGLMCYLGTSWPAEYRGQLLLGNIHGQRLNVDIPVREGSGYVAKHGADFLNFNDQWSQTLNQLYDQDGSMFVIDWYDKNQCHHNNDGGHDRSNGRVYKVVYQNQPKTRVDLAKLSDAELAKLVPSKNEWMSRHARRILQERVALAAANEDTSEIPADLQPLVKFIKAGQKLEVASALRDVVNDSSDVNARLRALWALHLTANISPDDAGRWVQDPDELVRAWTVQTFFENSAVLFSVPQLEQLADNGAQALARLAASDPSPVVRRFVASAAQRVPVDRRWEIVAELGGRKEDAADHNLPLLYWYATEGCVASDPERAVSLLKSCRIPKLRQFIARRLAAASLVTAP